MKKKIDNGLAVFVLLFFIQQSVAWAQQESKPQKEFKNTIHFNVTNPIIFGSRSIIFGYERVLGKHNSFTINIGLTGFPSLNLAATSELRANSVIGERGYHISVDYRYYFPKENKYKAPRGVYIGPYYSFNTFGKKHSWSFNNSSYSGTVETDLSLNIHTAGLELGYQFILWKRVSVDMILVGPGIAAYKLKASIGSNLSDEDKQKFFDALNNALSEKFPGYEIIIKDADFKKNGISNLTSLGYRYMVQIGFRF